MLVQYIRQDGSILFPRHRVCSWTLAGLMSQSSGVLSLTTLPTPVEDLLPYHFDHPYLVTASSLKQISLLPVSTSPDVFNTDAVIAAVSLPPYKVFKYHLAHSLLALLCADGIIHIWALPASSAAGPAPRTPRSICTLSAFSSLPPLYPSDKERRQASKEDQMKQMYSVLVHSSSCVVTGHRDGKIRVWDISDAVGNSSSSGAAEPRALSEPAYTVPVSVSSFLINGLLPIPASAGIKADFVSTDVGGFIKLWRFTSLESFAPELLAQYRLFDKAVVARAISASGKWLFAGGKEGGGEESACGLNGQVKAIRLGSVDSAGNAEVKELGHPCLAVWSMKTVGKGADERLVISLMRKGRAWLEVWSVEEL